MCYALAKGVKTMSKTIQIVLTAAGVKKGG